jgi:hypothetical protein
MTLADMDRLAGHDKQALPAQTGVDHQRELS